MPEFPKVRVKNAFFSEGEDAAKALASELSIPAGKLKRWLGEWTTGEQSVNAPEPKAKAKAKGELTGFDRAVAEAWFRDKEQMRETRPDRLRRQAIAKAEKKEKRSKK